MLHTSGKARTQLYRVLSKSWSSQRVPWNKYRVLGTPTRWTSVRSSIPSRFLPPYMSHCLCISFALDVEHCTSCCLQLPYMSHCLCVSFALVVVHWTSCWLQVALHGVHEVPRMRCGVCPMHLGRIATTRLAIDGVHLLWHRNA